MANVQIPFVVRSPSTGQAITGATVTVTIHATSGGATMYQDAAGTMPLVGSSYTTDGNGAASYGGNPIYIGSGEYDFQVSGPLLTTYTVRREIVAAVRTWRDGRSYTLPFDSAPASVGVVASYPISLDPGQTATLLGVKHKIVSGSGSIFAIQTDTGAHGTLSSVTFTGPVTTFTPAAGAYVELDLVTPLALADGDEVAVYCSTVGSSLGPKVAPVVRYTD